MPKDFCGPDDWVDGCDYDPEFALESWRVYVAAVEARRRRARTIRGRDHSYVMLDAVGNCLANIPGT